ncbi:MAG TPA: leucyl aminopeptidase [Bacteroidales bacterium]|nr:leucyl aminopeptidase [Bacteroidales bacterium]
MKNIALSKTNSIDNNLSIVVIGKKSEPLDLVFLSEAEKNYLKQKEEAGSSFIVINQYIRLVIVARIDTSKAVFEQLEEARGMGNRAQAELIEGKYNQALIYHLFDEKETLLALAEGFLLGAYRFSKYFTKESAKEQSVEQLFVYSQCVREKELTELSNIVDAVYVARDMVNEPVSELNAEKLAQTIEEHCTSAGCKVEILDKAKIEALKMGGLLAVNKGSIDPPSFTIVEWKPDNAVNTQPIVLVGKGIVYDTGGLSLKPTGDSMDYMKSDMSGAAIVAGVMKAAAANKLPLYLVALAPATDNRPSGNAYAPGDVVTISNGTTVEVLNSDAEGRMILADALVFAKKYNPQLVIDLATLTGAASVAIGPYALVAMGTASEEVKRRLNESAFRVFERMVEFPLWAEYGELIKSDIADLKNVGGKYAGAITAGKFLEHFTDYPWMHFDIAGVAFNKSKDSYRVKGGTGFGLRLLYDFLKKEAAK